MVLGKPRLCLEAFGTIAIVGNFRIVMVLGKPRLRLEAFGAIAIVGNFGIVMVQGRPQVHQETFGAIAMWGALRDCDGWVPWSGDLSRGKEREAWISTTWRIENQPQKREPLSSK